MMGKLFSFKDRSDHPHRYDGFKEAVEKRMREEIETGELTHTAKVCKLTVADVEESLRHGAHIDYPGGLEQLKKDMQKFERDGCV